MHHYHLGGALSLMCRSLVLLEHPAALMLGVQQHEQQHEPQHFAWQSNEQEQELESKLELGPELELELGPELELELELRPELELELNLKQSLKWQVFPAKTLETVLWLAPLSYPQLVSQPEHPQPDLQKRQHALTAWRVDATLAEQQTRLRLMCAAYPTA